MKTEHIPPFLKNLKQREQDLQKAIDQQTQSVLTSLEDKLTQELNTKLSSIEKNTLGKLETIREEVRNSVTFPLWKLAIMFLIPYTIALTLMLFYLTPPFLPKQWEKSENTILIPKNSITRTDSTESTHIITIKE